MARTELWTVLLADNLIRRTMLATAAGAGCAPREWSFAHALQTVGASFGVVVVFPAGAAVAVIEAALAGLTEQRIGDRPDRIEPRAIQRRPQPHKLRTPPQAAARAALLRGAERDD